MPDEAKFVVVEIVFADGKKHEVALPTEERDKLYQEYVDHVNVRMGAVNGGSYAIYGSSRKIAIDFRLVKYIA